VSKLSFYYAAMNAGKSAALLQSAWNYREQGMHVALFVADVDPASHSDRIVSRIGISAAAIPFDKQFNLLNRVRREHRKRPVSWVMVDEAQFLTAEQVWQLAGIADRLGVPVNCYGLRTDFRGVLFRGAAELMPIADQLVEINAVCHCGRNAGMVIRCDEDGVVVTTGKQVEPDKSRYRSLCRLHWLEEASRSRPVRRGTRRKAAKTKKGSLQQDKGNLVGRTRAPPG
jgi:thymidine kinase